LIFCDNLAYDTKVHETLPTPEVQPIEIKPVVSTVVKSPELVPDESRNIFCYS